MLTRGRTRAAWGAVGLVWLAAFKAWTAAVPASPRPLPGPPSAIASSVLFDTAALRSNAAVIRDRDPFRLERKPAQVRYDPWAHAPIAVAVVQPTVQRPTLFLVGILGGPPWQAVIEGIPGREVGVVMRPGEDAAGIRLIGINGDTAVLRGLDTTWVLTPKRAWP